jgi:hypothetical protein
MGRIVPLRSPLCPAPVPIGAAPWRRRRLPRHAQRLTRVGRVVGEAEVLDRLRPRGPVIRGHAPQRVAAIDCHVTASCAGSKSIAWRPTGDVANRRIARVGLKIGSGRKAVPPASMGPALKSGERAACAARRTDAACGDRPRDAALQVWLQQLICRKRTKVPSRVTGVRREGVMASYDYWTDGIANWDSPSD